jgi:hypothetical protein
MTTQHDHTGAMASRPNQALQPNRGPLPPHLKRWNWGAFTLNWVWGLGNGVYIALLMFVPGVNLVMPFVLGARGNEWAWQKGDWKDEAEFLHAQKIWSRVGVGALIGIPAFFGIIFFVTFYSMRHSEPVQMSFELARDNVQVIAVLGDPVTMNGWLISGNLDYVTSSGHVDVEYEISGSHGSGRIHFIAELHDQDWKIFKHTLTLIPSGRIIDLNTHTFTLNQMLYPGRLAV